MGIGFEKLEKHPLMGGDGGGGGRLVPPIGSRLTVKGSAETSKHRQLQTANKLFVEMAMNTVCLGGRLLGSKIKVKP